MVIYMNNEFKIIEGGVTAAKGFMAYGLEVGIKSSNSGKKDMAMIYSKTPCKASGTFTKNIVKAAPVKWDMQVVDNDLPVHAVVINSGVANACTGELGLEYCIDMAQTTAIQMGIKKEQVLICSTGVIGKQLPMDKIGKGIKDLVPLLTDTKEGADFAAEAIMTTDTTKKQVAIEFEIQKKTVRLGGMCKGSGMIHPNMCTMLGFVTTDINISKELLKKAIKEDVVDSFNMITVDGDTSTNDTLLILANGLANNAIIEKEDEDFEKFKQALSYVTTTMAKMMAGDGEGATALFEVKVMNAKSKEQARVLSKSVVSSNLTKAAIYGHDANWGRIICALGYAGVDFDPEIVDLFFESKAGKIKIAENGSATDYSEEEATKILSEPIVSAIINIKQGEEEATAWGCDLTYDYVKINADYRS